MSFDAATNSLWVAGVAGVDVLNAANGSFIQHIDTSAFGSINSVAIHNGIAAFAIESATRTNPGVVKFYDTATRSLASGIEVAAPRGPAGTRFADIKVSSSTGKVRGLGRTNDRRPGGRSDRGDLRLRPADRMQIATLFETTLPDRPAIERNQPMIETSGQSALAESYPPADAKAGGASWRPRAGNMTPGLTVANDARTAAHSGLMLGAQYQNRLIRAVESAIEIHRQDQFHDWLRGPFRMLLPHESVACLELDEHGGVHQVVCLHHHPVDPVTMELIGNPEDGLAVRLARCFRDNRRRSCLVDAGALKILLARDGRPCDRGLLRNAVIHRVKLLSGAAFRVVLVNVAEDRGDCCRQLFKLLSAHLTMALSRAIPPREQRRAGLLTERELEVLRWMGDGKSSREISIILDIGTLTLINHVRNLYSKLDVQSGDEAVLRGLAARVSPPLGMV